MAVVNDFALTTPLLGNQSFTSPVVDFLGFNTLQTASFYNTTDATQTTQQILFQFSAERNANFNFNQIVTMRLNEGVSLSFPIRARFGRYVITNTSSTPMTELRLSSLGFTEIQEVGINQVVDLEATLQAEDQRITDEIAARIAGDLNLQNQVFLKANQTDLNQEAVTRATEDIRLDQALAQRATTQSVLDEQGARESGDVLLQLNINAESTARVLGDTNLQTSIDSESTARSLADTNIQTAVDTKATITALAIETGLRETQNGILQTNINTKASTTELNTEIADRIAGDNTLLTNINLKASTTDLNTEIQNRQIADNLLQANIDTENNERVSANTQLESNLNFKLDKSRSIDSNLQFYCTQSQSLSSVISTITATGSVLELGSGSFGNLADAPLVIDKQNMVIFGPPATSNVCEILSPVTIPTTADRIRIRFVTFDGNVILNAKRSVYTSCAFTENVNIGEGADGFITMRNCEFVAGKTITVSNTFASALFFVNCNFSGANLVLNQASNQQVIINNCSGLVSFPSNATLALGNALTNGFISNNIAKTILPTTGTGSAGQVLTSSGSVSLPDTWTTIESGGGKCLEMICLFPAGGSITTARGDTVFLQNPFQPQPLNQTFAVLEGSQIQYSPPVGTKTLIYSFYFHASNRNNSSSAEDAEFLCRFGNTNMEIGKTFIRLGQTLSNGFIELSVVFRIDPTFTQDIPNGILTDFDNLTFIRFQGRCPIQNGTFLVNNKSGYIPFANPDFSRPKLKIEAYA